MVTKAPKLMHKKQSHLKGSLPNSADNTVTDLTSSTSSSDKANEMLKSNQQFIPSRVSLHATVSLKKKEKNWSWEFIDLSTLQDDDVEDLTFNIRTEAVSSTTPSKRNSCPLNNGPMLLTYFPLFTALNTRPRQKGFLHTWA